MNHRISIFLIAEKLYKAYYSMKAKSQFCVGKNLKVYGKVYMLNRNVVMGDNCILYPNVSFEGNGDIIIGSNVKIGTNTIICSNDTGGVVIGDNTIIAANVHIIDSLHNINREKIIQEQGLVSEKIEIGNDVWIASNCVVSKGTILGNGCVVGANSYVDRFFEDNCVIFGNPATRRKIR